MRVIAHYDRAGRITSLLAVNAPEGVTLMAQAKAGEFVSEIKSDSFSGLSGDALAAKMRETLNSYEVEDEVRELRPRRGEGR